jgi:transposase
MGVELEIVRRNDIDAATGEKQRGFKLLPKRWIVERTLGWAGRSRRLCRDHEATTASERSWFQLALVHVMLGRLA